MLILCVVSSQSSEIVQERRDSSYAHRSRNIAHKTCFNESLKKKKEKIWANLHFFSAIMDIPVYNNRIESLHLLYSLYLEFKNSQVCLNGRAFLFSRIHTCIKVYCFFLFLFVFDLALSKTWGQTTKWFGKFCDLITTFIQVLKYTFIAFPSGFGVWVLLGWPTDSKQGITSKLAIWMSCNVITVMTGCRCYHCDTVGGNKKIR